MYLNLVLSCGKGMNDVISDTTRKADSKGKVVAEWKKYMAQRCRHKQETATRRTGRAN